MSKPTPTKTTNKAKVKITVSIRAGPATPAQQAAFRRFYAKLISQVQDEAKARREQANQEQAGQQSEGENEQHVG